MKRFTATGRAGMREGGDWRLLLLLVSAGFGLWLVFQFPLNFAFQVGLDRGPRSDLSFLEGFRDAEVRTWTESWRWSQPEAALIVPGLGQQPVIVQFTVVSNRQNWQPEAGLPTLQVTTPGLGTVALPLRPASSRYSLLIPPEALDAGQLRLAFQTEAWLNPADRRGELGVAFGNEVRFAGVTDRGLVWPGSGLLLAYPAALGLLWISLRVLGFGSTQALALLLGPLLLLLGFAALAGPRLAVGTTWVVQSGLVAVVTAGLARVALPPLLRRGDPQLDSQIVRWLLLIIVATVTLKYGGKLYPMAMPGDVQFHTNRLGFALNGEFAVPSRHRGLPFPYPSGWYLVLLPLLLTGIPPWPLFQLSAALSDAASVLVFFGLMRHVSGKAQIGLLAALIYALSPIPMMNVWWSFQAQIGTQLVTLLALSLLIIRWPQTRSGLAWGWLTVLLTLIFLGHFGAFINVSLVVGLVGVWMWWRSPNPTERLAARGLLAAGLAAGSFAVLTYYSVFVPMFLDQLRGIATGGVAEVTDRAPLEPRVWLQALWGAGIVALNGGFLLIMGLAGFALMLGQPRYRRGPTLALMGATFAVGLSQAIMPLITRSTITTRWVTFAGWALTVGASLVAWRYSRRGWAGRIVVGLCLAYLAWLSLSVWGLAMATNQPPLEPF